MKPSTPQKRIEIPTFKGGEILVSAADLKKVIYDDTTKSIAVPLSRYSDVIHPQSQFPS